MVCITAGTVELETIFQSGSQTGEAVLTLGTPSVFAGKQVTLVNVNPERYSKADILPEDYSFDFFVIEPQPNTGAGEGIVQGRVVLGPTCPVERIPPDPQCAPRPYETQIMAIPSRNNKAIKTTQSLSDGSFALTLPLGDYTIQAAGGNTLPRCSPVSVSLKTATTTSITISCDTGIR